MDLRHIFVIGQPFDTVVMAPFSSRLDAIAMVSFYTYANIVLTYLALVT
jgi:hypothetical protein